MMKEKPTKISQKAPRKSEREREKRKTDYGKNKEKLLKIKFINIDHQV
jgi:hypothetical protein